MPGYYGIAPTPPRVGELWALLPPRLDSQLMQDILGGPGRIYRVDQAGATAPQGPQDQAWGRGVIAPVRRMFGEPESRLGRARLVTFLIRFDIHSSGGGDYDHAIPLEAAQQEAFRLVHGWTPSPLERTRMEGPLWRHTDPQTLPLWDNDTGVWFTSAEYRGWLWPAQED